MRRTRNSTRPALELLAFIFALAAAVATPLLPLSGWAQAALGVSAVLVGAVAGWDVHTRAARPRKPTPMTVGARSKLLSTLRDQAESELRTNLGWLDHLDEGRADDRILPYRIQPSSGVSHGGGHWDGDDGTLELTVDGLMRALDFTRRPTNADTAAAALVVGVGGTGKTTLLRMVQLRMLDAAETDPETPIPLLLPVQNWNENGSFEDYLREAAGESGVSGSEVGDWVRKGRAVALLLDGLDELPSKEDRQKFVGALQQFLALTKMVAVLTCRPDELVGLSASLHLFDRIDLAQLQPVQVREMLAQCWGHDPPEAVVDFADSWQKVSLLTEALSDAASAREVLVRGVVDLDALVAVYVRRRCFDGPPVSDEPALTTAEVECLKWVARGLYGDRQTHLAPDAIPYGWAPPRIQLGVRLGFPAIAGGLAGMVAAAWLSPEVAVVVTLAVWLSFTTDNRYWFDRNPRVVLAASVLAAVLAIGVVSWATPRMALLALAVLTLETYYTGINRVGHFAAKYVAAACFATALAAWGANGAAGLFEQPIVAGVLATLSWAGLLLVAAAFLFIPCGTSAKYHAGFQHRDLSDAPAWIIGASYGVESALWCVGLFGIPTLVLCLVAAAVEVDGGLALSVLVSPFCVWFMLWQLMVPRLKINEHWLTASIRLPVIVSLPVPALVVLMGGGAEEAILAQPMALLAYLGLCFVRGTDSGAMRRREGGALLRQPVYYGLLRSQGTIPVPLGGLLDRASRRLILKPDGNGAYSFEHALIRDHLAAAHHTMVQAEATQEGRRPSRFRPPGR